MSTRAAADITASLARVQARIAAACAAHGRAPGSVRLLAVSKTAAPDALRAAHAAGQVAFGESYVQEALPKRDALADCALEWHFIGPIQSNKSAAIAAHFDWVQGVDRLKIAQRLSAQRPHGLPPLNVCVQVNISGEAQKSGCTPQETLPLCTAIAGLPGLRLRGLMALPAPLHDADPRAAFAALRRLYRAAQHAGLALDTLSMGMSDDLEIAIAEGSTLLRIGSAIFGAR